MPTTSRNSCGYGVSGSDTRLDATLGAEVPDRGRVVACRDQGVGRRECWQGGSQVPPPVTTGVDLARESSVP